MDISYSDIIMDPYHLLVLGTDKKASWVSFTNNNLKFLSFALQPRMAQQDHDASHYILAHYMCTIQVPLTMTINCGG